MVRHHQEEKALAIGVNETKQAFSGEGKLISV